jgi:hypothetical protein
MIECAGSVDFLLESRQPISIGRECCWQDFDGHVTAKFRIAGAPSLTHEGGERQSVGGGVLSRERQRLSALCNACSG